MKRGRDPLSARCSRSILHCRFDLSLGFTRADGFDEALKVDPIIGSFGETGEDRPSASKREYLEEFTQRE
jgi:hypothetical protein